MIFRIVSFVSVAAVLAAGLVFATKVEITVGFDSASGSYSVKPADMQLVCPGPLFRSGGVSGTNLSVIERWAQQIFSTQRMEPENSSKEASLNHLFQALN